MDLNFVLNDSPTSKTPPRTSTSIFQNIENGSIYHSRPVQYAGNSTGFAHHSPASELPQAQLGQTYNPYHHQHQGHYSTMSARSSYSGPSLQSSTATSPREPPMASEKSLATINTESQAYLAMSIEEGDSFPGRHLPPLTNVHSHVPALPTPSEGPHSVSNHYHQGNSDAGYFLSTSHTYSYGQPQSQYAMFASSQQTHSHSYDNTLLDFAEVAMGTATSSGRRSLEAEAAAEVLAGRRESGDALRQSENTTRVSTIEQNRIAVSSNSGGNVSSRLETSFGNAPPHADIDPELRPASAGSVASTGRTVDDETSMIDIGDDVSFQNQKTSLATNDLPYNHNTPLFRQTPEVSTPRPEPIAISVGVGPPATVSHGPLATPDPPNDFLNQAPRCSYCNVCTTNSPLRKVVSHIFGRNKLSTRQIPKNVWVYYCRKHYQRSRYRNPRGFARQQVLLVKRQCERLQLWGGVKDWVIKVRRREELRMNREGDNGDELDELEDEIEDDAAGGEPEPDDGTPIVTPRRRSSSGGNNWIIRHTGTEKTIADIYILLGRIELEVQENGGKFPDVELLPNVDLAMAVPIKGHEGDGDEGGGGSQGGDENQGAEDDGATSNKSAKKRRRSEGGSGSSGGDEGNSRGAKKAKSTAVKKGGDRKGKGKASHAEVVPSDKVLCQSKGAHGYQVAYQRSFSPEAPCDNEPEECLENVTIFTGVGLECQTITPPPSASASTGRPTPEFEPEAMQLNSQTNSIAEVSYNLSPGFSAHALPSTGAATTKGYDSSLSALKSGTGFSLNVFMGPSLNEVPPRRPDALALNEIVSTKSGPFDGHNGTKTGSTRDNGCGVPGYTRAAQI